MSGHFQIATFPLHSPADLPDAGGCPATLAAGCPPSLASVTVGAACTANLRCPYVDGECACFAGHDSGAGAWACAPANVLGDSDAACPVVRPHLGASCPAQSGFCVYDFDCSFESCSCGEWVWDYGECPLLPNVLPPPVDAGAEGGADGGDESALAGSAGRDDSGLVGTSPASGAGATGGGGGCGCRVAGRVPGAESGAGVLLGVALLIERRRSRSRTRARRSH